MPSPNAVLAARGRFNALQRFRPADDPVLLAAQRDLAAATIEAYVNRAIRNGPPLTATQRARIAAAVLRTTSDAE